MRARNLKPGLFKNEKLGGADPLLSILFAGLWCMADREGRLEDRPLRVCAELFPYRRMVTEKKVSTMLDWLQANGFVVRYQVGGQRFIQVLNFLRHNNPHKHERPSEIPALSSIPHPTSTGQAQGDDGTCPVVARLNPSSLNPESGSLNPETSLRESGETKNALPGLGEFADQRAAFVAIQARYPQGLHRGDHWLKAERAVYRLLDQGVSAAELLAAVDGYTEQQLVLQNTGTERVMRPNNFFESGAWRGPFQTPKSVTQRGGRKTYDDYAAERRAREASGEG